MRLKYSNELIKLFLQKEGKMIIYNNLFLSLRLRDQIFRKYFFFFFYVNVCISETL